MSLLQAWAGGAVLTALFLTGLSARSLLRGEASFTRWWHPLALLAVLLLLALPWPLTWLCWAGQFRSLRHALSRDGGTVGESPPSGTFRRDR